MNVKKLYLDLFIKALIMAFLLTLVCLALAKIGERLDEQDSAQERYIQQYQAEIQREANKDKPL